MQECSGKWVCLIWQNTSKNENVLYYWGPKYHFHCRLETHCLYFFNETFEMAIIALAMKICQSNDMTKSICVILSILLISNWKCCFKFVLSSPKVYILLSWDKGWDLEKAKLLCVSRGTSETPTHNAAGQTILYHNFLSLLARSTKKPVKSRVMLSL